MTADPPRYEADPYCRELHTEVRVVGRDQRDYAILADTVFYPEGGGQPADTGRLGEARVVDVQRVEGEVRHYYKGDLAPGAVAIALDWDRRHDHMQHHTGQHLLTAVTLRLFGWKTTAFHLTGDVCDIELDTVAIAEEQRQQLEDAVAAEIRAARPVTAQVVSHADYLAMDVRSRGLPDDHAGDVRLIEIDGVDLNTCGGTHLRSTGEIECMALLGSESMRGGTRLSFVAGRRLRRRLAAHEERNSVLRALLGTGDGELVNVAQNRLHELQLAGRRQRQLVAELAALAARDLLSRDDPVVDLHFGAHDAGFLQEVARALGSGLGSRLAFLTAGDDEDGAFMLLAGADLQVDLPALGREVAATLGGTGGGKGPRYQGKCQRLSARPEALQLVVRTQRRGDAEPAAGTQREF